MSSYFCLNFMSSVVMPSFFIPNSVYFCLLFYSWLIFNFISIHKKLDFSFFYFFWVFVFYFFNTSLSLSLTFFLSSILNNIKLFCDRKDCFWKYYSILNYICNQMLHYWDCSLKDNLWMSKELHVWDLIATSMHMHLRFFYFNIKFKTS